MPDDTAGSVPPAPHITVLAVRPSTPFVSTTGVPQRNTPEEAPGPTAPQTLPHDEGTPAIDAAKPTADANAAETQGKGEAAHNVPPQTADAVPTAAKARTAQMFLLVALVLGIAVALIAIVSRIVGIYRRPKIFVDPDASWVDYRSAAEQRTDAEAGCDGQGVPFLDPQEHYGLADLQAQEWLDRSAPAQDESSPLATRNGDFTQRRSQQPSEADIALAIQVLRQARQNRVA